MLEYPENQNLLNDHTFQVKVGPNEIDNLNHVNNLAYLNWVLEAAEQHWRLLSSGRFDQEYGWLVLRHEIDYKGAAFKDDKLDVYTWIGDTYGLKSERFVQIKKDGNILVECKTIWCLIDRRTMRPVRIPDSITALLMDGS